MQDKRVLILVWFTVMILNGCSSSREALYQDLKARIAELSRKIEAVNLKVKDLEDSLFILDDRIRSVERAQQELKSNITALTKKITAMESVHRRGRAVHKREKTSEGQVTSEISTPENLYRRAYDLLMSKKYESARKLFENFLELYSHHSLADNAAYWAGECFYAEKKYSDALNYFLMVIEDYPGGNKVPDAMLKVAFTYEKLGLTEKAVYFLKKVITDFPFSEPAEKAKIKLNELEKEGVQP